jgi:hypothetical protein
MRLSYSFSSPNRATAALLLSAACLLVLLELPITVTEAFTTAPLSSTVKSSSSDPLPTKTNVLSNDGHESDEQRIDTRLAMRSCSSTLYASKKKRRSYGPCEDLVEEDDEDSIDEGRREAAFAMLGSVWSMGGAAAMMLGAAANPEPAHAEYGADAKMLIPNALEGVSDRINKQCLVESLGNRECLLYLDPDNKLYQGADSRNMLDRLEKASAALASIPVLAEQKKWSQVVGVTTGPMGTLTDTLNQLTKLSSDKKRELAKQKAQKVKTDVIAIGQAAFRKEGKGIPILCQSAEQHLADFVSSL